MLLRRIAVVALLSPFFAMATYAQVDTGSIVGTVTDATGASMVGASVMLSDEATNQKKARISGRDGSYEFSPLMIGNYTLITATRP
jgi:hypothetical protein